MNPYIPTFSVPVVAVSSFLYSGQSPEYLGQDQLTVELPRGYVIDVSWYPEHDPQGHYVIRVFFEFADQERMLPRRARDFKQMIEIVQELAVRFSEPEIAVSTSTEVANGA